MFLIWKTRMRDIDARMEGKFESLGVVLSSIKYWVRVIVENVTKVNCLTNSDIVMLNRLEIQFVKK